MDEEMKGAFQTMLRLLERAVTAHEKLAEAQAALAADAERRWNVGWRPRPSGGPTVDDRWRQEQGLMMAEAQHHRADVERRRLEDEQRFGRAR